MKNLLLFCAIAVFTPVMFAADTSCTQLDGDTNSGAIVLFCENVSASSKIEFTKAESSPGVPDWSKLHPSVDPALYAGSNLCSYAGNIQPADPTTCKFVLGRYAQAPIALDGKAYTLSLNVDQKYFVRVTGDSVWTGTVTSGHLYAGRAYLPFVVQSPGNYAYPTPDYTTRASSPNTFTGPEMVDPVFTTVLRRVTGPGQITSEVKTVDFATAFTLPDEAWSTPLAAIKRGGSSSFTTDGTRQPKLVLELPAIDPGSLAQEALYVSDSSGTYAAIDYLTLQLTANVTGNCADADCQLEAGISQDSGITLVSDWMPVTLTKSSSTRTVGTTQPVLNYWKSTEPLIIPRELLVRTGKLTADTTASKLIWTSGGEFNVNSLKPGARIYLTPDGGSELYCIIGNPGVDPADGRRVTYSVCTQELTQGASYNFSVRTASIVLRPKTVTAGRTFRVSSAQVTYQTSSTPYFTSAGGAFVCSSNVTPDTGEYICLQSVGSGPRAFAIHPGPNGGSRFLGNIQSPSFFEAGGSRTPNYWGNTGCWAVFWKSNPKKFWCGSNGGDKTQIPDASLNILVGEITGGFTEHRESNNAGATIGSTPCKAVDDFHQTCVNVKWSIYTPTSIGKGFSSQMEAFTAGYPIKYVRGPYFCGVTESDTDGVNEYVPVVCRIGQNRFSYYGVFTNGDDNPAHAGSPPGPRVVAATSTHGGGAIRWGSIHTGGGFVKWPWIGYSSVGLVCNSNVIGCGPFVRATTPGFKFPKSTDDITVTLQESPAVPTDPDPQPGDVNNGNPGIIGDAAAGDSVCLSNSPSALQSFPPILRIKRVIDSTHWVLDRSVVKSYPPNGAFGDGVNPVYLFMCGPRDMVRDGNINAPLTSVYWNVLTNPNGQGVTDQDSIGDFRTSGGHGFTSGFTIAEVGGDEDLPFPGFKSGNFYEFRHGADMKDAIQTQTKVWASRNVTFAGVSGPTIGNAFGSHLGEPPLRLRDTLKRANDAQPLYGTDVTATKVESGGCLWKIVPVSVESPDDYTYNNTTRLNRRIFATLAMANNRPLGDVSSTTKVYSTDCASDLWTYGVVRKAGELYPDSHPGEIYVKAPYVTHFSAPDQTNCASNASGYVDDAHGNPQRTICITNNSTTANTIHDMDYSNQYLNGEGLRGLSHAWTRIRNVSGFWKGFFLPGCEWLVTQPSNAMVRNDAWAIRVPAMPPPDAVKAQTFVSYKVAIPEGPNAVRARVKFGYDIYGPATAGYCTSRKEACYAIASAVVETDPFKFAGDLTSDSGVSCSNGCEINLPIPSGMTVYFQVEYLDGDGNIIAVKPWDVGVTP